MKTEIISVGDEVQDKVSGFKGIVTARTEYINGCTRLGVQGASKNNAQSEPAWIDEPQVKLLKRGVVKIGRQETGGPRPDAVRQNPDR